MRSSEEIAFRLRQEFSNLWLWALPPRLRDVPAAAPLPLLPDPRQIAAAAPASFVKQITTVADELLGGHMPLLGTSIQTGDEIHWRRDPFRGVETEAKYFRLIPYLDVTKAGDHKVIWEVSRHQHFVLLVQAWLCSGQKRYLDEVFRQWESWEAENPFQEGINWASALEVAFRALSWIWVYHLCSTAMDDAFRRRFLESLRRHGLHLEPNLSVYFSPNTHLLGEAVVLHALGRLFPFFPEAERWRRRGREVVAAQMDSQVNSDGSHFEQSSYYHVYAIDFFLFHALLEDTTAEYRAKLTRMCVFLDALMGRSRCLPLLGDDDGGRMFHPYGDRRLFGRATLATAALALGNADWEWSPEDVPEQALWWLGPQRTGAESRPATHAREPLAWFADTGIAVFTKGPWEVVFDAGPFGRGSGGHSHSDTLAVVVRHNGSDVLIDPGTYTYVGDPEWRERFRGSAAHNTVRIDGLDQAAPAGPFRWADKPRVSVGAITADSMEARCEYRGFEHIRRVSVSDDAIRIDDRIALSAGEHLVEQFWHVDGEVQTLTDRDFQLSTGVVLSLTEAGEVVEGWKSPALGAKEPAEVIRVAVRRSGLVELSMVIRPAATEDWPQRITQTAHAQGSGELDRSPDDSRRT